MNKTLEDLWYSYQTENPNDPVSEKKHLAAALNSAGQRLRADLTDEQKEALENYEECLNEIGGIAEREAFIKGVRFATKFLIEAMYEE